jgi:outer membrane protein assembly factor BamB
MNPKLFRRFVLILGVLIIALLAMVVRLGTLFVASTRPLPTVRRANWDVPNELPEPSEPRFHAPPLPRWVKPFVSATPPTPASGHWPQWRGPKRDNVSTETGLLKTWPECGPPLLWQVDGIGQGKGGIAVAGGLIFVLGYRDGLEFLTALDGTGRVAWATPIGAAVNEANHMRWLSQRTLTVDDDRVYAVTARGVLLCLDSGNGELLWQRDYGMDFGGKPGTWGGYCDFPLADGPVVICAPSGPKSTVVALDRRSGATVWACDVPTTSLGTQSTLIPCVLAGIRQYVIQLAGNIVGSPRRTAACSGPTR